MHREFVYPAWQFDSETGQPLECVSEIVAASERARLSPLGLHLLMVSTAGEDGTSPADWLAAGRRTTSLGSSRLRTRTGLDDRPDRSDQLPGPPRGLPELGFGLEVVAGVVVFRLHWEVNPPGPKRYLRGRFRFDAPGDGAEFPVTYGSIAEHGAFAEVYGDMQLISSLEAERRLSALVATRRSTSSRWMIRPSRRRLGSTGASRCPASTR